MKTLILIATLLATSAVAQDLVVDGGLTVNGTVTMNTPNGGHITLTAVDYGTMYTHEDGGLLVILTITGQDYVINDSPFYSNGFSTNNDTDCYSFPTGYCAIGEDIGESSLGTINVTIPYNLRVTGAIDAGTISVQGEGVCTEGNCMCTAPSPVPPPASFSAVRQRLPQKIKNLLKTSKK